MKTNDKTNIRFADAESAIVPENPLGKNIQRDCDILFLVSLKLDSLIKAEN